MPGIDGLLAKAYQRLTMPVKRGLAANLWDIVTGITPIPPEWVDLVHPVYKKGDWAQPGNWRPIFCATIEVKLVWTLILGRIASAVFVHVPASMWGAMAGRSPPRGYPPPGHRAGHEPLRDDHRRPRCLRRIPPRAAPAPLRGMGCHGPPVTIFHDQLLRDAALRRHHSRTLYPLDRHGQGGAEGPFLYLLVTLPLAFELAR